MSSTVLEMITLKLHSFDNLVSNIDKSDKNARYIVCGIGIYLGFLSNTNVGYFHYTSTTSLRGDMLLLIWLDILETVAYLDTRLQSQKYCFVFKILTYLLDGHDNLFHSCQRCL
jgi:hypothetical protein